MSRRQDQELPEPGQEDPWDPDPPAYWAPRQWDPWADERFGSPAPRVRGWQPNPRGMRVVRMVVPLALVLTAVSGATVALLLNHNVTPQGTIDDQTVYGAVEPSIVDVTSALSYAAETAEGTGFVIDARDGLVITNNHVIDGATDVTATMVTTGRTYQARVVGDDTNDDIALLQLEGASSLTTAPIGNASNATLGAPVLGIGNSGGQGGAPAVVPGYISSLGRTIKAVDEASGFTETLRNMLQVTAQIEPGDSGGPLADAAGQVIGIDTAATQSAPGTAGEGFAIPIGTALSDARQIRDGRVGPGISLGLPGFLGVLATSRTPADSAEQVLTRAVSPGCLMISQEAGVPAAVAPARYGALVEGVFCASAAATAGLSAGDVITAVAGRTVGSLPTFSATMNELRPGQRVALRWVTITGADRSAIVRLGDGPAR
ncbi:MAG: trypsin-like peptidase domain-containing protein [Streptosporangiaceae bacterium]